jgi:hypothetical protein
VHAIKTQGEWYSCTNYLPRLQGKVSGQLHVPATLRPEK